MFRRPALGFAELGTGAQCQHWPVQTQAETCQGGVASRGVDAQRGVRIRLGQLGARLESQRHEALDHQRVALLVELAHVVEQAETHLAAPARALGDTGEERHQRRLQGVGQQDRLLVLTAQALRNLAPGRHVEHAVPDRKAQRLAHFGHAFENRPAPLGRQHVDLAVGMALFQADEQRLRHHHVANPAGSYDQYVHKL